MASPKVGFFGWSGEEEAKRKFNLIGHTLPKFTIPNMTSSEGKIMLLYEFVKKLNQGKYVENIAQQIGDCTSWGTRNAVVCTSAAEIVVKKDREQFYDYFPPFFYSFKNLIDGERTNSDGSNGITMAKGIQKYGALPWDVAFSEEKYSGTLARNWGRNGAPQKYIDLVAGHTFGGAALVTSYEQVRDAIYNGNAVNVCSDVGYERHKIEGGKLWGVRSGSWSHSMALIAMDESNGEPGIYCLNSWGPNSKPADPFFAPPGGFWLHADDVDRMVRQRDSYAYMNFNGFAPLGPILEKELFRLL